MHTKTIAELIKGLRTAEFSSEELTKHYLERIHKFEQSLNSFITITEEFALKTAKEADQRRSQVHDRREDHRGPSRRRDRDAAWLAAA